MTEDDGRGYVEERKVFEADMLFATLDTTVRRIAVERGREFLLSDTVGFIHRLPTALIEAFRSTLEEVTEADLLLQIVDGSDPRCQEQIQVTKNTIDSLGAGHIPMITVYNKADLLTGGQSYPRKGLTEAPASEFRNVNLYLSAREEASIRFLAEEVLRQLEKETLLREYLIPYDKGGLVSLLCEQAGVEHMEYTPEGTRLTVRCRPSVARSLEKQIGSVRSTSRCSESYSRFS